MLALSPTLHMYARPETKDRLLAFFTEVLGFDLVQVPYVSSPEPMYAFEFGNGTMLSIEFTDAAPQLASDGGSLGNPLDDQQVVGGAWMEIATDDPDDLKRKCLAFGLKTVRHAYTPFEYVQAPGGQVFRIVSNKEAHAIRAKERGIGVEKPG